MKLPGILIRKYAKRTCKKRRRTSAVTGFTVIEILVVLALVGFIASLGVTIGLDSYRRFLFYSERDTLVSILQRARSEALSNTGSAVASSSIFHGLFMAPENAVLFRGPSYALRDSGYDITTPLTAGIVRSGISEIVFAPLTGEVATSGIIILDDGVRNATITVNAEGGIMW